MPSWRELKRFCERDGWELYKDTDHYFYRKVMDDGSGCLTNLLLPELISRCPELLLRLVQRSLRHASWE